MAEDITERLRTNTCRYAAETEQEAAKRRIAVDLEAANEIDSLRAQLASAELSADELRRQRDDADARIAGWRSRAEAAEAAIASARKALEEIIDVDTVVSDGGKVHDHGPCAERAIRALSPTGEKQ